LSAVTAEWIRRPAPNLTGDARTMTLRDNLILLGAAGLVTGLLVPFVSARMNDRRLARQREAEEDLARDSKFIEAQAEFLDGLSADLWRLAGKVLAVSYYALQSPQQFADAWRAYDDASFADLFTLRAHVSRGRRLLSAEAQQELAGLHHWLLADVDPGLTAMARRSLAGEPVDAGTWRARHTGTMDELFNRIDKVLTDVARDVGLIDRQHR
jgi:hypothetical protein